MTDTKETKTASGNTPSHAAYVVRERENAKGFWTRIGSVWPHGDGYGYTIQLECVPIDGRIVLRTIDDPNA